MDRTFFFFFPFWMEQISNLGNSSTHKSHSPFFPYESQSHSWARRKPDFLLQLSLEIFNSFNHKWWIHPAQSLQTIHGRPLKAQWRPGILAILLSLYPLSTVYCLLTISFFVSLSFFFLFFFFFFRFFFCFFISYLWLMLDFYSFAISLLQNCLMIAQEGLWFFFLGYICLQGVW